MALGFNAKFVDGLLCIDLSRLEDDAGEVCAVGTVGEVLCFEAEGRAAAEGGTMLATGRGEVLTKLADLPETIVVLAKPRALEVSTAWVYQHYNKGRVVHAPCIWQLQDRLAEGAPSLVPYMGNVLETVTIPAHPIIASIKATMLSAGAYYALMSGSGPTVVALAKNQETAESIIAALADFDVEAAITTTVGRIY